jgi:hypothetical protein
VLRSSLLSSLLLVLPAVVTTSTAAATATTAAPLSFQTINMLASSVQAIAASLKSLVVGDSNTSNNNNNNNNNVAITNTQADKEPASVTAAIVELLTRLVDQLARATFPPTATTTTTTTTTATTISSALTAKSLAVSSAPIPGLSVVVLTALTDALLVDNARQQVSTHAHARTLSFSYLSS